MQGTSGESYGLDSTLRLRRRRSLSQQAHRELRLYEGLDYGPIDNKIQQQHEASLQPKDFRMKWAATIAVVALVGFATGVLLFFAQFIGNLILKYKIKLLSNIVADCSNTTGCFWWQFLAYVGISTGLIALASLLVAYFQPFVGSGEPEMQAFLNGINMPSLFRVATVSVKVVAVILAKGGHVMGDFAGPALHIGAAIGSAFSQGKLTVLRLDSWAMKFFRADNERRTFVSAGASAGFAAMFGSPIGGLLYSVEQGSSFWTGPLSAVIFFCCALSLLPYNFFQNGLTFGQWGHWSRPGMFDFGQTVSTEKYPFKLYHFPIFVLIGVMGGLLGVAFNLFSLVIMKLRIRYVKQPFKRVTEGCLIGVITSLLTFIIPYYFHSCKRLDPDSVEDLSQLAINYETVYCPPGHFSQTATLLMGSSEDVLRSLSAEILQWDVAPLAITAAIYVILSAITYGTALPVGFYIPSMISGAALGRVVGIGLTTLLPDLGIQSVTFTMLGAASLTSGVSHLSLSLTVILIEATDYAYYALPVMVAVMVARSVSSYFVCSINVIFNRLNGAPILDWSYPQEARLFRATDVMNKPPICFFAAERVEDVYQKLQQVTHNGFAVVDSGGHLLGTILRSQLHVLLKHKAFITEEELAGQRLAPPLNRQVFVDAYPKYYRGEENTFMHPLSRREQQLFLDLTPYMNLNPMKVIESCPLTRVYRIFRTLGLRHLVVVDAQNVVKGMITRKNLSKMSTLYHYNTRWLLLNEHKKAEHERNDFRSSGTDDDLDEENRHGENGNENYSAPVPLLA